MELDPIQSQSYPDATADRGSWPLLMDPLFGPFFGGRLLSGLGVWITNIVLAILAFQISGSAFAVGLVSVAQFGPQLFLAPLSGAMADRGKRKAQVIVGRAIVAVGSGGLAITIWLVGVEGLPGVWVVIAAAGVVGTGFVTGGPAMNAILPSLVGPKELPTAMALNNLPFSIGRAVGPALGAFIVVTAGPAVALAIAAGANATFVLIMVFLPIRSWSPTAGKDRRIRAGLKYVRDDKTLVRLLVGVAAVGIGADPILTLTPALASNLAGDERFIGILASAFGVGAVIGVFVMTTMRRRFGLERLGTIGLGLLSVGLLSTGLSPTRITAVFALVIGGFGMTTALTGLSTQLQERLTEEFRGRVMGIYLLAFLGSRPIAGTVNGLISDGTSPRVAFAFAATVVMGIALWVRAGRTPKVPAVAA